MNVHRLSKKQKVHILLGVTFTIIMLVVISWIFSSGKNGYSSMNLRDGWKIIIQEKIYDNVSLNQFSTPKLHKGDVVTMQLILPDAPYTNALIRVYTNHCAMSVYLEGNEIYQYGVKRMNSDVFLGSGYHFVELPSSYAQKNLTIQYHIAEDGAFSSIYPVVLSKAKDSIPIFLTENRLQLFIGSFLMIFGISFLLITVIMSGYEQRFIRILQISFIFILTGLWTLENSRILQIFVPRISFCTMIEFLTLYLIPIPLMLYFYDDIKELKRRSFRILYWVLTIGLWGFDLVVFSLHALNLSYIQNSLPYFMLIVGAMTIYVLVLMITQVRKKELSSRIQMFGLILVIIIAGVDLVRFSLFRLSLTSTNEYFVALLPIGIIIYAISILISFCIDVIQNLDNKIKQEELIQQAYMDTMTSIPNRRFCEETMEMFEHIPDGVPYGILNIDINNLKYVNDSFGHERGDYLITIVADTIYQTFHKIATVGRMGGDEFIVLVPDARGFQLNVYLKQLLEEMNKLNEMLTDFDISISYGYATSWEVNEKSVRNVYNLADSRMYQYKEKYKIVRSK